MGWSAVCDCGDCGVTSTGLWGLWFVFVFYDWSTRRLNRKWFHGEAGNWTCDPWFLRQSVIHVNELVLPSFLWVEDKQLHISIYKRVCYHKHWLFYVHSNFVFRKSVWHLHPTLRLSLPYLNIRGMIQKFWSLSFIFVQRHLWEAYYAPFKRWSVCLYNDANMFSLYRFD